MMFPSSAREIYDINPLFQVVCQIRYPAILSISASSPAQFQDGIRDAYPLYEEQSNSFVPPLAGVPKEIANLIAATPFPQLPVPPQPAYHFFTESRARQISLTQEFIAVTEHQYSRWEDFKEEVKLAERVLCETYAPAFYRRVGLRYVDVLDRRKLGLLDTPWSELFNPSFIGLLGGGDFANHVQELQAESLLRIPGEDQGQVHLRHGLARSSENDDQVYLIDADFYTDQRSKSDDLFTTLDRFNRLGGNLFRWAISEKLRTALGPTKI